jgi:outer membrane scaffolding protein for murein synthesis (MipA/OmpV family)
MFPQAQTNDCSRLSRRSTITTANRCFVAIIIWLVLFDPACGEESKEKTGYDTQPLWEVGIGGFAGSLPDYPAAEENTFRALAVPVPIYRGKILRVGDEESRGAVSGRFINKKHFEFDVTLSAAFSVDSGSNDARRDMPDLDYLFGIGPQLIFKIINEPNRRKLNLNLQARAVYSTDFSSLDSRGYVFNPKLKYTHENVTDLNLTVSGSAGPIFATEKLMDYFYQVDPEFVTPRRPAYDADAGYLGSNFTLSVSKRFDRSLRLVLGTRLGVHTGATNDDSPLFKEDLNVSVFTAFFWSFFQSEKPAR